MSCSKNTEPNDNRTKHNTGKTEPKKLEVTPVPYFLPSLPVLPFLFFPPPFLPLQFSLPPPSLISLPLSVPQSAPSIG